MNARHACAVLVGLLASVGLWNSGIAPGSDVVGPHDLSVPAWVHVPVPVSEDMGTAEAGLGTMNAAPGAALGSAPADFDDRPDFGSRSDGSAHQRPEAAPDQGFETVEGANLPLGSKDGGLLVQQDDDVGETETLQEDFETQDEAPQWTAAMRQALQNLAPAYPAPAQAGITQEFLDCRQSVCKLVLRYADKEALDVYVDAAIVALKGRPGVSLHLAEPMESSGMLRVDLYLTRPHESRTP